MRTDLFLLLAAIGNLIIAVNVADKQEAIGSAIISVVFFVGAAIIFELKSRK